MIFKRVGIIAKNNSAKYTDLYKKVFEILRKHGSEIILTDYISSLFPVMDKTDIDNFPLEIDLCIIFGGDGTFLYASRLLYGHDVPLAGVNLGRLGFLTEISADRICTALAEILEGNFIMDFRLMLKGIISKDGNILHENYALNDIVVTNKTVARVTELDCYINSLPLATYIADGIIISTSTGSSAYSLSVGGPIINPRVKALLIAPISPHSLTHRPLVIPEDSIVTINLTGNHKNLIVTSDGQVAHSIEDDMLLTVRAASEPIKIIHAESWNYYEILKEKLHWGIGNAY